MAGKLVRLDITVREESYDRVVGVLSVAAASGWEEQSLPTGETLFRVHCEDAGFIQELRQAVEAEDPEALCEVDSVEQQDWVNVWKEYFTPVPCGRRFVVLPPWRLEDEEAKGRIPIVIEPKSAFGTGHHATTALCLSILSDMLDLGRVGAGQSFLDLGTGSGVLGLGLCKSGLAGEGYDIDPIAVDNAVENRQINAVQEKDFKLGLGSIEMAEGRRFDVVVANILAQPLIDLAPSIVGAMKGGGVLVLSGLLTIQADRVEAAYMAEGLSSPERVQNGEWCALFWK